MWESLRMEVPLRVLPLLRDENGALCLSANSMTDIVAHVEGRGLLLSWPSSHRTCRALSLTGDALLCLIRLTPGGATVVENAGFIDKWTPVTERTELLALCALPSLFAFLAPGADCVVYIAGDSALHVPLFITSDALQQRPGVLLFPSAADVQRLWRCLCRVLLLPAAEVAVDALLACHSERTHRTALHEADGTEGWELCIENTAEDEEEEEEEEDEKEKEEKGRAALKVRWEMCTPVVRESQCATTKWRKATAEESVGVDDFSFAQERHRLAELLSSEDRAGPTHAPRPDVPLHVQLGAICERAAPFHIFVRTDAQAEPLCVRLNAMALGAVPQLVFVSSPHLASRFVLLAGSIHSIDFPRMILDISPSGTMAVIVVAEARIAAAAAMSQTPDVRVTRSDGSTVICERGEGNVFGAVRVGVKFALDETSGRHTPQWRLFAIGADGHRRPVGADRNSENLIVHERDISIHIHTTIPKDSEGFLRNTNAHKSAYAKNKEWTAMAYVELTPSSLRELSALYRHHPSGRHIFGGLFNVAQSDRHELSSPFAPLAVAGTALRSAPLRIALIGAAGAGKSLVMRWLWARSRRCADTATLNAIEEWTHRAGMDHNACQVDKLMDSLLCSPVRVGYSGSTKEKEEEEEEEGEKKTEKEKDRERERGKKGEEDEDGKDHNEEEEEERVVLRLVDGRVCAFDGADAQFLLQSATTNVSDVTLRIDAAGALPVLAHVVKVPGRSSRDLLRTHCAHADIVVCVLDVRDTFGAAWLEERLPALLPSTRGGGGGGGPLGQHTRGGGGGGPLDQHTRGGGGGGGPLGQHTRGGGGGGPLDQHTRGGGGGGGPLGQHTRGGGGGGGPLGQHSGQRFVLLRMQDGSPRQAISAHDTEALLRQAISMSIPMSSCLLKSQWSVWPLPCDEVLGAAAQCEALSDRFAALLNEMHCDRVAAVTLDWTDGAVAQLQRLFHAGEEEEEEEEETEEKEKEKKEKEERVVRQVLCAARELRESALSPLAAPLSLSKKCFFPQQPKAVPLWLCVLRWLIVGACLADPVAHSAAEALRGYFADKVPAAERNEKKTHSEVKSLEGNGTRKESIAAFVRRMRATWPEADIDYAVDWRLAWTGNHERRFIRSANACAAREEREEMELRRKLYGNEALERFALPSRAYTVRAPDYAGKDEGIEMVYRNEPEDLAPANT